MGCLQKECCPGWFFQLHRTELSVKRRICPSVPQALCCVWTLPPPVPHKVRKSWMHKDHLSPRLNFHTVASLWTKISTTYFRPEMIYSYFKKTRNSVQSSLIHRFLKSRHPFLMGLHNKLFPERMASDERHRDEGYNEEEFKPFSGNSCSGQDQMHRGHRASQ